jgi:hypothetical protein
VPFEELYVEDYQIFARVLSGLHMLSPAFTLNAS